MSRWIDVSAPLRHGMPKWPDDPDVRVERVLRISAGAPFNLTYMSMSAHTGTHMDAPLHFVDGASAIDAIPLDVCIGPALVVEAGAGTELEEIDIKRGGRLLIKSRGDFVAPTEAAAERMAAGGLALLGLDGPSADPIDSTGYPSHRILMQAGVWIVENLNLGAVAPGPYDLICLPMKIEGSDGAPARVLLRRRKSNTV